GKMRNLFAKIRGFCGLWRRVVNGGEGSFWRRVQESNPRPEGRPGFRDRLRTAAHYPPLIWVKTAVNSLLFGQDGCEQPFVWFSRRDSNSLPSGSEPDALSNELREIRRPSSRKSCKED